MKFEFTVEVDGSRLDVFLAERVMEHSRSKLQTMIRSGMVQVDGVVMVKPAYQLRSGEAVRLEDREDELPEFSPVPPEIDIIHEEDDFLVLNKPPGIVVHPSHGHESGTLADGAVAYAPDIANTERDGLVHRLDKDTSGAIIFAKDPVALDHLQSLFKAREVEKTYLAIVDGAPPSAQGRIEASIARDPRDRQRYSVQESGAKEAITEFQLREQYPKHALLEAHPLTGRTHQIRLHMKFIDCPIVGDTVYGRKRPSLPVGRHMLHAWRLRLPGRDPFEAPIPEDFTAAVEMAKSM